MYKAEKRRIIPTAEQEKLFWKSAGCARFIYNRGVANFENGIYPWESDFRKDITQLKKTKDFEWLNEVGSNVLKQAVKDLYTAQKNYREGRSRKPTFKRKFVDRPSFYVNYESFRKTNRGFRGEKLGEVKLAEPISVSLKYSNPRIIFEDGYWFLTVGVEIEVEPVKLTDGVIGIDLGLKNWVVTSQASFANINKSSELCRLYKKLKRVDRKLSRRRVKGRKPSQNYIKAREERQKIHARIRHIRMNAIHHITNHIVKTKPAVVCMEDLKIKNMMKNKHLSDAIGKASWYTIRTTMQYKCERQGTQFILAPTNYPSTQLCSNCGERRKMKLSERTYNCNCCGFTCDRDVNACYNLANYARTVLHKTQS